MLCKRSFNCNDQPRYGLKVDLYLKPSDWSLKLAVPFRFVYLQRSLIVRRGNWHSVESLINTAPAREAVTLFEAEDEDKVEYRWSSDRRKSWGLGRLRFVIYQGSSWWLQTDLVSQQFGNFSKKLPPNFGSITLLGLVRYIGRPEQLPISAQSLRCMRCSSRLQNTCDLDQLWTLRWDEEAYMQASSNHGSSEQYSHTKWRRGVTKKLHFHYVVYALLWDESFVSPRSASLTKLWDFCI